MPGPIQSVERAAAVLHLLGAVGEPVPLGELARTLDLAKPTVHGLVRTLVQVGFVAQDPETGHYALGTGLRDLGAGVDRHLLRARAVNWADGLAARTGLEVQLGVLAGTTVELVHHVFRPDDSPQRLRAGEVQPLHATALGLVLLAFSPAASRLRRLELAPYTPGTVVSRADLDRRLRAAQRQGWAAVDGSLRPGVAALAAPVRHRLGVAVGALGVVGPRDRLLTPGGTPRPGLPEQVTAAAHSISATLQDRL